MLGARSTERSSPWADSDLLVSLTIDGFFWFVAPLRILISDQANERIGLTSLRHERCAFVARHCRGKVLDLGCGTNKLAAIRPHVIGLDVYPWPEIDLLAADVRRKEAEAVSAEVKAHKEIREAGLTMGLDKEGRMIVVPLPEYTVSDDERGGGDLALPEAPPQ